jgi:hypothetical protein
MSRVGFELVVPVFKRALDSRQRFLLGRCQYPGHRTIVTEAHFQRLPRGADDNQVKLLSGKLVSGRNSNPEPVIAIVQRGYTSPLGS